MDILNPTAETLVQKFNGCPYAIEPNGVLTVSEEIGNFLIDKLGGRGLQVIRYGDDVDSLRYKALGDRIRFLKEQIGRHEAANVEQEKNKFNALPEPKAVKEARILLPIYERHYAELQEALGKMAEDQFAEKAEATLKDHGSESKRQLIATAKELGIKVKPIWNKAMLLEQIRLAEQASGSSGGGIGPEEGE